MPPGLRLSNTASPRNGWNCSLAPRVTRVAAIRDPTIAAGTGFFGAIQSVAPSIGVELTPLGLSEPAEIEQAIAAFARSANSGLIVTGSPLAMLHRNLIITLAARYKLPAAYFERGFAPRAA